MSNRKTNNTVPSLRLDRLLSNLGYGSRREVRMLVEAGLVTLDGVEVEDSDKHIPVTEDLPARMCVDGEPLDPLPGMVLMFNKPPGATCSHKDSGPLVYGLLPDRWMRRKPAVSTVGRLDKETSGLLLFTDDGALIHRIISPRSNVTKRYHATLEHPLRGDEGGVFASGKLLLEDESEPLLPVRMEVLSPTSVYVTLSEGRYHQVRRMFAAVGNHVTTLHRDRIGQLFLPADLLPGQYRIMSKSEVEFIF
jgi:16S rRNA pseudouridine516 synthase